MGFKMSFKIDKFSGAIIFLDGFQLLPPYDHERYFEYVAWVAAGNSPTEVEGDSLLAAIDIEVKPDQARNALDALGLYDAVLALMADPSTPRAIKIKWEFTLSFRRNDPSIIMMAKILGWDKAKLDEIFNLAKTL